MARLRVTVDAFARLIAAVAERPRSYKNIEEETGLHYDTVRSCIKALKHHKQVHIDRWEKDSRGRWRIAMFVLGFGVDAEIPRKSAAERKRDQRTRQYVAVGKPPSRPRKPKRLPPNSVFQLGDRAK